MTASTGRLLLAAVSVLAAVACQDKSKPFQQPRTPLIFEEAFELGTQIFIDKKTAIFQSVTLGEIHLPEGKIVVGDPKIEGQIPFRTRFPKGRFPVQLAVAYLPERAVNAFLRVRFSDADVVHWRLALRDGQSIKRLHLNEYYGVIADSERLFVTSAGLYRNLLHYFPNYDAFKELLSTRYNHFSGFSTIPVNADYQVVVLRSGLGKGVYAAYIGYDKNNQIAMFLIDFNVIPWWVTDGAP